MSALIFDLDGTLSDSLPLIVEASQGALAEAGVTVSRDRIISYIGFPLVDTGELLLGSGRGQEYFDLYQKHYHASDKKLMAFPGIVEMLQALKLAGHQVAIATSKKELSAMESLAQIGVVSLLDAVVTVDSACGIKPGPGPALKAMALLQASPERSLFVGDSLHDLRCAKAAGVAFVGVTWGACSKEQLLLAEADYIAEDVADLTRILA
ncbi:MAG: HAD-IA family hydrolase, partial [Clostridiales bacterium]